MIINTENGDIVVFGKGSIGLTPASLNGKGVLAISEVTEGKVGRPLKHEYDKIKDLYKEPLIFEFEGVEGLDMLIRKLNDVRQMIAFKKGQFVKLKTGIDVDRVIDEHNDIDEGLEEWEEAQIRSFYMDTETAYQIKGMNRGSYGKIYNLELASDYPYCVGVREVEIVKVVV